MFGLPIPNIFGLKGMLIGCAISVVTGAAAGGWIAYKVERGNYVALQLADAKALATAVAAATEKQRKIDHSNQEDAVSQAYFKGKMDATNVVIQLGVPANVTFAQDKAAAAADRAGCVTYGFVRVLVAGERIVAPDSLDYPSGQSADSCTALEPSALAAALAADLAAGAGNGHQLDALIAAVKKNDAILAGP